MAVLFSRQGLHRYGLWPAATTCHSLSSFLCIFNIIGFIVLFWKRIGCFIFRQGITVANCYHMPFSLFDFFFNNFSSFIVVLFRKILVFFSPISIRPYHSLSLISFIFIFLALLFCFLKKLVVLFPPKVSRTLAGHYHVPFSLFNFL